MSSYTTFPLNYALVFFTLHSPQNDIELTFLHTLTRRYVPTEN